ncbi:MAG: DUF4442 domain-containing protein, partial [Pedobacter sp.]
IQYLKPGRSDLYFTIVITDEMLNDAITTLNTSGKFVKAYPMEITDPTGEICATVMNEVYIRNLRQGEQPRIAY